MDSHKKMVGEPYVHASKSQPSPSGTRDDEDYKIYEKKEMNVSTDKKTNWKIKIFCEYIDERRGFLSVTDIIWINFSEEDLNLIAQKRQEEEEDQLKIGAPKKPKNLKFESCE